MPITGETMGSDGLHEPFCHTEKTLEQATNLLIEPYLPLSMNNCCVSVFYV